MLSTSPRKVAIARWLELPPLTPQYALVAGVDLVIVRYARAGQDEVSVLYGRCHHRGALLADGYVQGDNLICGVHNWDWRFDSGVSEYNNDEKLHKFSAWVEDEQLWVDEAEIEAFAEQFPQPFQRDEYQGTYADTGGDAAEPHVKLIQSLARDGLSNYGQHGPSAAMGVSREDVPSWDDLQVLTAQMARKPLLDEDQVNSQLVIGPRAAKPLVLDIPLFVSDMSFGALSAEAKVALAQGAEAAGTGICSGEGGMLPADKKRTLVTSTSLPAVDSVGRSIRLPSAKRSISRVAKERRRELEATCRVKRSMRPLRRCEKFRRGLLRLVRRLSQICTEQKTSEHLPKRCARPPAASLSVSSCRRSTSKPTSTLRWSRVLTTSFLMAVVGGRDRPRPYSAITFQCPPFRLWRELVNT